MIIGNFIKRIKIQTSILLSAVLILSLLTTVYIFGGCAVAGKTYTESNNGDNLNLKINDVITIKLESNATTGYKWNLSEENNSTIITLVSSDYSEKENKDNLVGAGGFETLTFKAVSGGNAAIILTYNRQWEKEVQPEKIFKLNISVQ
jgi:inhibitor of cysteine peptidase